MKRFVIPFAVAALLSAAACSQLQLSPEVVPDLVSVTVNARVDGGMPATKSQYAPDQNSLHDLNLFVFDSDGVLVTSQYREGSSGSVTMSLTSSETYSIRALANWGSELTFASESALLAFSCSWPDFQRGGYMVMAGSSSVTPVGSSASVFVSLRRLASKVSFMIDDSALGAVTVTSARLCQAPVSMLPFAEQNRASQASDVSSGDWASASDLASLNAGGTVEFFSLENLQGTLLSGNTDPWAKVPDSIPSKSALCTYVEVSCTLDGVSSVFDGDVTYRFFLGNDNSTNFDVRRNTDYTVTLVMSTNLDAVSWKIDSDVVLVTEGHGTGSIADGRQTSLSSLYMGEKFVYGVTADDALSAYFGDDLSGAELRVLDSGSNVVSAVTFSSLTWSSTRGCWVADAACKSVSGALEVWLYDPSRSRYVQKLSAGLAVLRPSVAITLTTPATGTHAAAVSGLTLTLNGGSMSRTVLLVDDSGCNLGGKWFDNSLFTMYSSLDADSGYEDTTSGVLASVSRASTGSYNFGTLTCAVAYTGSPLSLGYKLADLCSSEAFKLRLHLTDSSTGMTTVLPLKLECKPVTFNYDCTALTATVNNPSRLPLSVSYYDFTYFGPGTWDYDGVTSTKNVAASYTMQGSSYVAMRSDCVNYSSQCFGYSDVGSMEMVNGEYDLSGTLMDYYTAYAMLSAANTSASGACSTTYTVFDVLLQGESGLVALTSSGISTSTAAVDPGVSSGAPGSHGGLVLFSSGNYVGGSSGVCAGESGEVAIGCGGTSYIYSPALLTSGLALSGSFGSSSSIASSGDNSGSTQWLGLTLSGGCSTKVAFTYRQVAAVKTLPNGYGDNLFSTREYAWQSPYSNSEVQAAANPGNNRLSYVYMPGTSTEHSVSGTLGVSNFTSSNYTLDGSLFECYEAVVEPGVASAQIIPVSDFINRKVFTITKTDSAKSLGKGTTYSHRYHPGDCSITGTAETTSENMFYRCTLGQLFTSEMSYFNSGYEGFYTWVWRDISAPFNPTEVDTYSAGSNCDRYTTWYFRNRSLDTAATLRAGTCIHVYR